VVDEKDRRHAIRRQADRLKSHHVERNVLGRLVRWYDDGGGKLMDANNKVTNIGIAVAVTELVKELIRVRRHEKGTTKVK
jgi:hypothetical protein